MNMDHQEITENETFTITDLDSLNWVFRKMHTLKVKEDKIKSFSKKEYERVQDWNKKELKSIESKKEYFTSLVKVYHQRQLQVDPDAKTISTPYGTSKSRTANPSVDRANEAELLEYLVSNELTEYIENKVKVG